MSNFQEAALSIVNGEFEELKKLISNAPSLINERSPKHGASLMHYVGANGPVEDELQKTPSNAVEIARFLIEQGCDVDATIDNVPESTPLVSLVTSHSPAEAGLQRELVKLFVDSGAAVDGVSNDGYPLACAMFFQYRDAVQALLESGAKVDNIVSAAATGDLDFVKSCFSSEGKLSPEVIADYPEPFQREFAPKEILDAALEHAQFFNQEKVTQFLSQIDRET